MRDKYGVEQDTYCYSESTVLKNLLNIRNLEELEEAEAEFILTRVQSYEPIFTNFDLNHLKTIHYHLFQDLYSWAGQIRTVDISKGNSRFCTTSRIEPEAEKLLAALNETSLSTMNQDEVASTIAEFYCDLNVVHPFRDGNGRTQRLFFDEFVGNHHYKINWDLVSRDEWVEANIAGFHCDYSLMTHIFARTIYSY
ncbi:Fic family protein [Pleionea sp. CnH1-48]|uniref:Fic/DOC family protein n=1 Tax=Pleionea sp. CnH1-48 TaxID=2954494 RepID=UPI002098407D|nr:Fic family protein [Pleionea sp. CnH1-48]MCO7225600.1 Fic family protein [Pleionea sp. CnH1-48]